MTITLTPEVQAKLELDAKIHGINPNALANTLLGRTYGMPLIIEPTESLEELLEEWRIARENVTAEELAVGEIEWAEFKANMNRNRADEGRVPVFLS